ncbi:hypothetical protein J0895_07065 [Phormidium pseudopriestleyi FRX01]|uniref:Uncharacterized protein n=1 Tax=Phormidium pseudopriestleyi FRX01 TaxID=1759528 RepID=A0ABS3FP26_9CYAN|nr:hypothetical protein [Phormidium pseudopriestleyi]MBO0348862.1 hypothetical protein [Phormidium pseudopriestleyi FRX01]
MALTAEEEEKVRQLLLREEAQEQEAILATKQSFKEWLKETATWLFPRLTEAAIQLLIIYLKGQFGIG